MPDRPNIVLIYSDQHRGDTIGCVGHPVILTPNLDRIATEGVLFRRCSTSSPLCVPARATLISGHCVNQHGAWDNSAPADRQGSSHVRNIRDASYHTALIGKTHLLTDEQGLRDWGYEDTMEIHSTLATTRTRNPWTEYLAEKGLLDAYSESILEYNRVNWSFTRMPWREPPAPIPTEDHVDNFVGRKAVDWIRSYKGDKPFYLQVLFPGPHPPFNSAPEYRALYRPDKMPIGILESPKPPIPPYVDFVMRWSAPLQDMTPLQMQLLRTFYYAKVTMIDERIGDILKALEERGMLHNTWIIYTSDHGENLGDHRLNQKVVFYETAVNVPFIIRPPGGTTGWQANGLTDHLDLINTLLDIAGASPLEHCDGSSLVPKVQAGPEGPDAQEGKERIFSEVAGYSMVRTERYKLAVDARTRQQLEFYDMEADPDELHNQVNEPSLDGLRQELQEQYLDPFLRDLDREKFTAFEERSQKSGRPGIQRS
ncbi:MAG TPA: sulfatase-like hydrolase/transferase [Dehalococcoidales bacterium]|nr:sulfatase-like hydrolase/transferase [Dehalococcoidales bacterium]